jgi:hypothetical protein
MCLLTGLTSQLGITITVLLHQRPVLHQRHALLLVFLLSAFGPALIVSAIAIGCTAASSGSDDNNKAATIANREATAAGSDWWWPHHVGGCQFVSYLTLLGLLSLLLMLVGAMAWRVLSQDRDKVRDADPVKTSPLAVNLGTLRRAAIIAVCLLVYNAVSLAYVNNWAAESEALAVCFGVTSGLVGSLLLFCYILRSESYVIVWCGTNKVSGKTHHYLCSIYNYIIVFLVGHDDTCATFVLTQ